MSCLHQTDIKGLAANCDVAFAVDQKVAFEHTARTMANAQLVDAASPAPGKLLGS